MNMVGKKVLVGFVQGYFRAHQKGTSFFAMFFALMLGIIPFKVQAQSFGTKIFESNVQIPSGASTLSVYFSQARQLKALLVTYQPSAQCSGFSLLVDTGAPGRPWTPARNVNGYFMVDPRPATVMKLKFTSQYQTQICLVTVQNFDSSQNDRPPQTRVLLGNISFRGGFSADQKLEFPEVTSLAKIQVFLPRYCHDLEILEASIDGVQSEFAVDPVEDPQPSFEESLKWYEIKTPLSRRAKSLRLSLSGPVGQVCDLPVYGVIGNS